MDLPMRRDRLAEREAIERSQELAASAAETPEEKVALVLELADLLREIGEAADAPWAIDPPFDLPEKALRLSRPLALATKR